MFSIDNIYLTAIIHGLLQVTVLIFTRRGNRQANGLLALLVGLLSLSLWNLYTYNNGLPAYWRLWDYSGWYSGYFWAPTIYFYVGIVTDQIQLKHRHVLQHYSLGIFLFTLGTTIQLIQNKGAFIQATAELIDDIELLLLYVQLSLYLLLSFQMLTSYRHKLRDSFSSIENINLSWLFWLLVIFAVLIIIDMIITVPAILSEAPYIPYVEIYLLAEALAIFAIGYASLLHSESLFRHNKPKYQSSPLHGSLSLDLANKLKAIMQDEKPYRNNELKLDDLAQLVDINPSYLSQVINEQYHKNFYDFINEYRAKFAAELLLKDRTINITEVIYSAGFNNRTTFNRTFKKLTGMTPSQYRRSQDKEFK